MPHDMNGHELIVGDKVTVALSNQAGVITQLDDTLCGATVQVGSEEFFTPTNRLQRV